MSDRIYIDDFLKTLQGQDTAPLLARAEEAMNGMLVLNGTGPKPVFVGIPPRWEENPCGVGGYTWTMSRLNYMVTLCKAFLLTGNRDYLDKVETDLWDWFRSVPAPPVPHDLDSANYYHCVHNWRMLEVGYRMVYTFPILLSVLKVHGKDRKLVDRIYLSIAEHAERISAGSHLLWPGRDHNHYTEEINGLLSAASMLPEDPRSPGWIEQAMDGLEHACACQMTEDGAQTEGSAQYHTAVVINFCYSIHFAKRCGNTFSDAFVNRVKDGLDFAIHTLSPDGNTLPFGDSDPVFYTPYDAAMLSYLLFGETRHLSTLRQMASSEFIIRQLSERFPWGFEGISDLLELLKKPAPQGEALLPLMTYQRQMNQYIVRTGWHRDAACLYFSSDSPMHPGSNHAHMDQLGIIFAAYGKVLLQDPARYTYKDCEDRHLYKSSQVHNVPTVNGEDAFAYLGTFAYGPQKEGRITGIMDTDRIKGAFGYHRNYDPVTIRRTAALIDGTVLLIADTYEHVKGKQMKVFFHLNSTRGSRTGTVFATQDEGTGIRIHTHLPEDAVQAELLDGRMSDVFYHEYPSKRAVYPRIAEAGTETMVFACVPFDSRHPNALTDLRFDGETIAFTLNGKPYRIAFRDGQFTVL